MPASAILTTPRTDHQQVSASHRILHAAAWVCVATVMITQISYPVAVRQHNQPLTDTGVVLTTIIVLACAGAAVTQAIKERGRRGWAALVVPCVVGLTAEVIGTRTALPFGSYHYTDIITPHVFGVPWLIPVAWAMLAWPAWEVTRTAVQPTSRAGHLAHIALAAVLFTSWDLFLDPQMVGAGVWQWHYPDPGLPGVPGIPLTNYAGWLVVAFVVMTLLTLVLPSNSPDRLPHRMFHQVGVPYVIVAWTLLGGIIANAGYFGRPAVAWYGGVVMGATLLVVALGYRRTGAWPWTNR